MYTMRVGLECPYPDQSCKHSCYFTAKQEGTPKESVPPLGVRQIIQIRAECPSYTVYGSGSREDYNALHQHFCSAFDASVENADDDRLVQQVINLLTPAEESPLSACASFGSYATNTGSEYSPLSLGVSTSSESEGDDGENPIEEATP